MRARQHGIKRFELLIAVTVIALLSAVAVPAVNGYVYRARVARAVGDIALISRHLDRWRSITRRLPHTLVEAGLDDMRDPWGHGYRYLNIARSGPDDRRRDRNLAQINTDFDLYSLGRDGATAIALDETPARDDVVRADNGEFVGLASNY